MATVLRRGGPLDGLTRSPRRLRRVYRDQTIRRNGPHEGWHQIGASGEPQFGPLWRNATVDPLTGYDLRQAPAGFYKDNDSLIWFRGVIEGRGAAWEDPILELPPGYRPAYSVVLLTAYESIAFLTNGKVDAVGERKNARIGKPPDGRRVFSLEALQFRAGN
ncbi:MAG: hypothetical protein M3R09_00055 [Actinomycetota bacterium]|nr:hypothetical protein [Actinomycetota bacterium]